LEFNPGYADEIIFVNNSCNDELDFMVGELAKKAGVPVNGYRTNICGFDRLRDICLKGTAEDMDYIHWVDTDDFYHTGILTNFKNSFLTSDKGKDLSKGICYFYHCMGCPWLIEEKYPKDNFFKYNPDLKWESGVHERLVNLSPGQEVIVPFFYYHTGYIRSVISTAFKWVFYAVLEHQSADIYIRDDQPMYTEGIDKIIADRIPKCRNVSSDPYDVPVIPEAFLSIFSKFELAREEDDYEGWQDWVTSLDPFLKEYRDKWAAQAVVDGHWGECIRDIEEKRLWEKY